jgi:DNA-binding transcriptional LysR family regulator
MSFVLMVSASHPLARRDEVSAGDIHSAGLITAPMHSAEWPHYESLLRAAGVIRPRITLEVDGVQARLMATQAGLGVMGVFVPPYAEPSPGLVALRLETPAPTTECGLVTVGDASPAVEAFAAGLRAAAGA